ncbi:hypothetical protein [Endozoicomonas sp. Mp262]|uniref:head-tail joining protein n=1 Tax=Endozoicomonas sp. Mp262 TaxID=2919499 RepID=UPI0021DA9FF1
MSNFNQALENMDEDVVRTFGEPLLYTKQGAEPLETMGIVDYDVIMNGEYAQVQETETMITLLVKEVGTPDRGDTIQNADNQQWIVDRPVNNDRHLVQVAVISS